MRLTVGRELLPESEADRNEFLKKYFCELAASATANGAGWEIQLARPTNPDFYIDPVLSAGLEWWSKSFGRTDVAGIPTALHRTRGWQLSLNDSWTLYSWSKWLQELDCGNGSSECLTVLHLDDHDDLMTPRVAREGTNTFRDLITGATVELHRPETVAQP